MSLLHGLSNTKLCESTADLSERDSLSFVCIRESYCSCVGAIT